MVSHSIHIPAPLLSFGKLRTASGKAYSITFLEKQLRRKKIKGFVKLTSLLTKAQVT